MRPIADNEILGSPRSARTRPACCDWTPEEWRAFRVGVELDAECRKERGLPQNEWTFRRHLDDEDVERVLDSLNDDKIHEWRTER